MREIAKEAYEYFLNSSLLVAFYVAEIMIFKDKTESNKVLTTTETGGEIDSDELLNSFTTFSDANQSFANIDQAHLFTGRDLIGSTLGLAWNGIRPGVVFQSMSQATGTFDNSVATVAHEMGHNYGMTHDGAGNTCSSTGFVMSPIYPILSSDFSTCSIAEANSHLGTYWGSRFETVEPPTVSQQINFTAELGDQLELFWTFNTSYPQYYELTVDGILVESEPLKQNQSISYVLSILLLSEPAIYEIDMTIYDIMNRLNKDAFSIDVKDTIPPKVEYIGKSRFIEGDIGNKLIWKISDFSDGSLRLFEKGSIVLESAYQLGSLFEWDFSSTYKFGDYNFTLEVTDNSENGAASSITVVINPSLNSTTNSESSTTTSMATSIITTSSSTISQNERSETDSTDSPTSPLNGFIFPTSIFVILTISQIRKKKS
ncbi:MAG: hypothetical protein GPJ54_05385 [Candidatus Heimdallarchaeota archaeon]|nr:hypothetical protein [Candidatus Heimdallarchaeota archaeon]